MEILSVAYEPEQGRFRAVQELPAVGGGTYLCLLTIPEDTLEWRAAEYEIDPAEVDLLMDIVLYESVMPIDNPIPLLYRAETIREAREGHVSAILSHKRKIRPVARAWKSNEQKANRLKDVGNFWIESITDDALLPIRQNAAIDPEVIAEKNLLVQEDRARFAKSRGVKRSAADRVEKIRAMRLSRRDNDDQPN